MFNQVFLVGRLLNLPNAGSVMNVDQDTLIHLEVARPYDGYEDHQMIIKIPVMIWSGMAKKLLASAHSGSYLAIKGRLLCDDESSFKGLYVCGESVRVLDFELSQLTKGE